MKGGANRQAEPTLRLGSGGLTYFPLLFSHILLLDSPFRAAAAWPTPGMTTMKPPVAKKVKHEMVMFGDVRNDDYYWLRDDSRSDPEVLSYLEEENAYTQSVMQGSKAFQEELYKEIRGRIKEDDISAPLRDGPYYYYEKTLQGKQYVVHCRRRVPDVGARPSVHDVMPTGPDDPPEHVILDENVKAEGHDYYSIDAFEVSPNHKLVAYAEDTKGNEIYTVYVIDAETGEPVGKPLTKITSFPAHSR